MHLTSSVMDTRSQFEPLSDARSDKQADRACLRS